MGGGKQPAVLAMAEINSQTMALARFTVIEKFGLYCLYTGWQPAGGTTPPPSHPPPIPSETPHLVTKLTDFSSQAATAGMVLLTWYDVVGGRFATSGRWGKRTRSEKLSRLA